MRKVLLLGAAGMLGSSIYDVLKDKYALVLSTRNTESINLLEWAYGGTGDHRFVPFDSDRVYECFSANTGHKCPYLEDFISEVGDVDRVINAIGDTRPFLMNDPALTLFVNGALPHILARVYGGRLIQITTDCVFDGISGFPYKEDSVRVPVDIYGLSKSLGEPESCLTIRTSLIGRELKGFTGLLGWFLQQEGKEIEGYAGHFWNGITTKQFGAICDQLVSEPDRYPRTGLYHVFSTVLSKYEMLVKFRDKFDIPCIIRKEQKCTRNRTLDTGRELNALLKIPSFDEMLEAL